RANEAPEDAIADLTGWSAADIRTLSAGLGLQGRLNTLENLDRLREGFRLARTLGSDVRYLSDLADRSDASFGFFARHAAALLDLLKARYSAELWPQVYKPIHDMLAIRKRDALTALAMQRLGDKIQGHNSPDLLYEYLLLDAQTGSETETSRIVQATSALQLYVQRCLMNLESGVDPTQIPLAEWEWMKNYRVWEANRKVFLYPENYIEPELRDTKTPLFEALESELTQNDVNEDSVAVAYTHYLDQFAAIANLDIVGSYLDVPNPPANGHAIQFSGRYSRLDEVAEATKLLKRDFTIELWVKLDADNRGVELLSVFDVTSGTGWRLGIDGNQFAMRLTTTGTKDLHTLRTPAFESRHWYHLAATYSAPTDAQGNDAPGTFTLYLDGVAANLSGNQPAGDIRYGGAPLFVIGSRFRCQMREVRIWNQARTKEQIAATMFNGVPPTERGGLLRYWSMDTPKTEEPTQGSIGKTILVTDLMGSPDLRFAAHEASWVAAPSLPQRTIGNSPIGTTLYLVGRNNTTKEYFIRQIDDGTRWQPWQKIDLSINAEFVTPVVAFNKLYLFWAELEQSVRSENRVWANYPDAAKKDQIGAAIDPNDSRVDESAPYLVHSKGVDVIQQVNRPIHKATIKYSFYNFSKTWVQPQTYTVVDAQLDEWQRRQPQWQQVYAQRWRNSIEPPWQLAPQDDKHVSVAQLGPNSLTQLPLARFDMAELTISFWLRSDNLKPNDTTTKPPTREFTLF
ncbi:MAG TPA: neuraminidase-like domain-containing protein, partial [Roseiflexaceae bacterium]|nr:neuraminidase-like domain-containing protein [Roseiflexaceae bacterium]